MTGSLGRKFWQGVLAGNLGRETCRMSYRLEIEMVWMKAGEEEERVRVKGRLGVTDEQGRENGPVAEVFLKTIALAFFK